MAVPLMVYVVGVKDPHLAIGTSAFAVAVNAMAGLASHARARNVVWRCGIAFALAGVIGALAGSSLGKAIDGQRLLFLFAFGLTTAANYAASGLVDWSLAGTFILGGLGGTVLGTAASRRLSAHKGQLNTLFAGGIVLVAIYMLYRSWVALSA